MQEKETRVKFNPGLSANRPFEQLGPGENILNLLTNSLNYV